MRLGLAGFTGISAVSERTGLPRTQNQSKSIQSKSAKTNMVMIWPATFPLGGIFLTAKKARKQPLDRAEGSILVILMVQTWLGALEIKSP